MYGMFLQDITEPGKGTENVEEDRKESDTEVTAVWPVWPVGLNSMKKTPVSYPRIPLPSYTTMDFSRMETVDENNNQEQHSVASDKRTAEEDDKGSVGLSTKHVPALTKYNSAIPDRGDVAHLTFSNPEWKKVNGNARLRMRLGLVPRKHMCGVKHSRHPLNEKRTNAECDELGRVKKQCTTGMLGVQFMTVAHKR